MSSENLIIYKKTENLLFRIYPSLRNFPKSEKFCLCHQIKMHFIDLMQNLSLANSVKSKRKTYLQQADGFLQNLKVLMRLSRVQKYISVGFHEELDMALTEINKMLVGWIKHSASIKG